MHEVALMAGCAFTQERKGFMLTDPTIQMPMVYVLSDTPSQKEVAVSIPDNDVGYGAEHRIVLSQDKVTKETFEDNWMYRSAHSIEYNEIADLVPEPIQQVYLSHREEALALLRTTP